MTLSYVKTIYNGCKVHQMTMKKSFTYAVAAKYCSNKIITIPTILFDSVHTVFTIT